MARVLYFFLSYVFFWVPWYLLKGCYFVIPSKLFSLLTYSCTIFKLTLLGSLNHRYVKFEGTIFDVISYFAPLFIIICCHGGSVGRLVQEIGRFFLRSLNRWYAIFESTFFDVIVCIMLHS